MVQFFLVIEILQLSFSNSKSDEQEVGAEGEFDDENENGRPRKKVRGGFRTSVRYKLSEISGPMLELPFQRNEEEERKFLNNSRLWMANIPKNVNQSDMKKLFEPFGEIDEFYYDEEKNFALIRLDYKANAEKAIKKLDKMNWKGSFLTVKFSLPACSIKVRNLSPYVSNELLEIAFSIFGDVEKAVVAIDDRGKPTGEGIVEYSQKFQAQLALRQCNEKLFFLTASPRPVIVEPLTSTYDGDGFKEKNLNKLNKVYLKERLNGPRFGSYGTFEHSYGRKWKRLYEVYDSRMQELEKAFCDQENQLLEDIEDSQFEYETELLRQEVREREAALEFTERRSRFYDYDTDFMNNYNYDDDYEFIYIDENDFQSNRESRKSGRRISTNKPKKGTSHSVWKRIG